MALTFRSRLPETPLRLGDVIVLGVGVGSALVTAVASTFGLAPGWALAVLYCAVAIGAGVWLLSAPVAPEGSGRRWRRYLALALVVWAIGQTELAFEDLAGDYSPPDIGDVVGLAAFPLAVAGITRAIRSEAFVRPVLRMVVDAFMLASAVSLLVWRVVIDPDTSGIVVPVLALLLFLEILVAAFGVLVFIRRPLLSTALFAGGLSLFALADGLSTATLALDGALPPAAAPLLCLAVTMFATGTRMVVPEPADGGDLVRDLRQASITILVTAVVVSVVGVHVIVERRLPTVPPIVFTLLTVGAFFVRHLVDHSQRRVTFEQLRAQATSDPLTCVQNRFALDALNDRRTVHELDVIVVGIDGFEHVNESLGHAEGDALLVRVAEALADRFEPALAVVRLESDEFALVTTHCDDVTAAACEARETAAAAAGRDLDLPALVRVTAGAAVGQPFDTDVFEVVARAQRARHLASMTADVSVRLYDDAMQARDQRDRLIDARLCEAVESGAIVAHYQPLVGLASGEVRGVEALARWTDPLLGVVTPDEFIVRAEATGCIDALGTCVLRQVVQAAVALGLPARNIATGVNVSPTQLRRGGDRTRFSDEVAAVLAESGLPPEWLVIEVTEQMLVEEHDGAIEEVRRLRAMGVQVAIDDFGSGYWAFGYFRWLEVDTVKIDRALVEQLATDARARAVVASIVDLAERMGMNTVAEGVEDADTVGAAWDLGVRGVQGYAYARPVPLTELLATIDRINAGSSVRSH